MGYSTNLSITPLFFTELRQLEVAVKDLEAGKFYDHYHLKSLELRLDRIRDSFFSDATKEISDRISRIQKALNTFDRV